MPGQTKPESFSCKGGLDLISSPVSIEPGSLLACNNYICTTSGYQRVGGFERFDGQPAPSVSVGSDFRVTFDNGQIDPPVGAVIYGESSSALGVVLSVSLTSGAWITKDAAGSIVLSSLVGDFVPGELIVSDGGASGDSAFSSGFSTGFQ